MGISIVIFFFFFNDCKSMVMWYQKDPERRGHIKTMDTMVNCF